MAEAIFKNMALFLLHWIDMDTANKFMVNKANIATYNVNLTKNFQTLYPSLGLFRSLSNADSKALIILYLEIKNNPLTTCLIISNYIYTVYIILSIASIL
jgi:hypothetical protein